MSQPQNPQEPQEQEQMQAVNPVVTLLTQAVALIETRTYNGLDEARAGGAVSQGLRSLIKAVEAKEKEQP